MLAQYSAQSRMQKVRGRVVALCVATRLVHKRPYGTWFEFTLYGPRDDNLVLVTKDPLNFHAPAIAFDIATITDLTASFRVERVCSEFQVKTTVLFALRHDLRIHNQLIVADPLLV